MDIPVLIDTYNPATTSPACSGRMEEGTRVDEKEFDSASCNPAWLHSTLPRYKERVKKSPDDGFSNHSPYEAAQYVQREIFPFLLPAINDMLVAAKERKVLQRKRTNFNACDFLTQHLYRHNPHHTGRGNVDLWDIPFVKRISKERPRPPLPLSLQWSEEEAATVIQSAWHGYVVRRDPDVQELRQYQKEMKEESYDINFKIEEFWSKHPVEECST